LESGWADVDTGRHTYRSWLDAVGTPITVQQKMMRHQHITTTLDIYGDVVTDEMATASVKVAQLTFQINGAQTERTVTRPLLINPPSRLKFSHFGQPFSVNTLARSRSRTRVRAVSDGNGT